MIVCIDGCIGSGKTSVLEELHARGYTIYKEGVDNWSNYLQLFYDDPQRWGFTLQMSILMDMHHQYANMLNANDIVFVERSPGSALVFVENSKSMGYMCREEYDLYQSYYNFFNWTPDTTIQLTASPGTCYDRVRERNREGEEKIGIEYLEALCARYAMLPGERIDTEGCSIDEIADNVLKLLSI